MNIYKFSDDWLDNRKYEIRENTYINYSYAVLRFKKHFDDLNLADLSREKVIKTFAKMADSGCSKSSIYNVRQVMSAVYNSAIEQGYARMNPFKRVKIPEYASCKIVDAYTVEQEQKIIEAACEDVLGDIFIFLLLTGLRRHELINLKWDDYDPIQHTICIRHSKTKSGVRTIAVSAKAELIILRQKKFEHNHIFSNTKNNPISATSLKKLYMRLEKKVGFDLTNHKCRHTFCTRLVEAKVDPKTICTLSGHKSVAFMLQRYVTSDYVQQRIALEKLDRVI